MDRTVFFDRVRAKLAGGKLTTGQVQGFFALMDSWTGSGFRQLAYVLATAWHETAATMHPVTEYGGKKYFTKYDTGKLAANLGNTPQADGDGYLYRGRGYVQITGARNYRLATSRLGVNLVGSPDKALDPAIAAKIIIRGMIEGWFTGKKLSDYIGAKVDYKGARRIVNGTDKAALIAGYADTIEAALRAAGADKPAPAKPEIIVMQPASPQPARNPIAAFFAALFGWLNVDK